MKCNCQKKLQESRINPIVQLSKHYYRRSKHEGGPSMCAAMNGFFHWRKLINFALSLSEYAYKACALGFLLAEIRMPQPC